MQREGVMYPGKHAVARAEQPAFMAKTGEAVSYAAPGSSFVFLSMDPATTNASSTSTRRFRVSRWTTAAGQPALNDTEGLVPLSPAPNCPTLRCSTHLDCRHLHVWNGSRSTNTSALTVGLGGRAD